MIDIQKMVDEGEPVYVVNKSASILGKSHLLVIEFPNPSGGRGSTVKIPPIKYPINISRQVAPPAAIPMSRSFINWVNRGVLKIIPRAEAEELLSRPEVKNAVDAAYDKLDAQKRQSASLRNTPKFNVRHGGARETRAYADLDESTLTAADFYGNTPEAAHPLVEVAPQNELRIAETEDISPRIQRFCADLVEDPSLKKDFLQTLKSWDEDELSDDELGYMLDQLGSFENISSYVRSLMAERAGVKATATPSSPKGRKRKGSRSKKAAAARPSSELDEWLEE